MTRTDTRPPSDRVRLDGVQAQRRLAHLWIQGLSDLARANLPTRADDSHTALIWEPETRALRTAPLPTAQGPVILALGFDRLDLTFFRGGMRVGELSVAGLGVDQVQVWLDSQALALELTPGNPDARPYPLPDDLRAGSARAPLSLTALGDWFDLAHGALSALSLEGPVFVWPHHFDMATYQTLGPGDGETAPGVGLGLSPGDTLSDTPYFYVGPWPRLRADELQPAPPRGVADPVFGGYVLRAAPLLAAPDQGGAVQAFFEAGLKMARTARAA